MALRDGATDASATRRIQYVQLCSCRIGRCGKNGGTAIAFGSVLEYESKPFSKQAPIVAY